MDAASCGWEGDQDDTQSDNVMATVRWRTHQQKDSEQYKEDYTPTDDPKADLGLEEACDGVKSEDGSRVAHFQDDLDGGEVGGGTDGVGRLNQHRNDP